MNYKKSLVFLTSFCIAFFGNIIYTLSCGGEEDPYDYYVSFFNPTIKGEGYEPFYYTSLTTFYSDPTPSEETANVADWQGYTGSKVTVKDIRECIYTYSQEQLSIIANGSNLLPDSVKQNTFTQFLLKEKNREAARYLLFAKTCEPAVINADPWSVPERNTVLLGNLYKEGEELYNKTRDKDIRDRYAFQLIRLQHYSKEYAAAATSFDKLFGGKEASSLVYYKALSLKAGALLRMKDSVQGAYLFSRVFEKAPSLRIPSFTGLMWANTTARDVYPLCKDNHEKGTVAAVYGLANADFSLAGLREVYAFDPASPTMTILLGRELNKLEQGYLSPYLEQIASNGMVSMRDYAVEERGKMLIQLKALQQVVDSLIDKGKLRDMDLWRISSAYLSYMGKDYAGAKARLDAVKAKDADTRDQWEIINLLVNINQQKTIDSTFESKLLASFKWLDSKTPESASTDGWWGNTGKPAFFRKTYRNLLFAVLAPRYHQQGDLVKEALIRGRCDSLHNGYGVSGETAVAQITDDMNTAALIRLNDFLRQPVKTPYETYLVRFFPKEINMSERIGISYMRVHDFSHARDWFKKTPASAMAASYQAFREQLQDFGEDTAIRTYNKPINQLQFCERMVQLEGKMKTTPVSSSVYYDYASALFSISYYGKTWFFVKDYRPSTDWYTSAYDKDPFTKQYFGCYAAESYYLKAAQASTDREFRARCAFMAARCSQKHTAENNDSDKYLSALIRNRYFPLLATNFADTKFYQQVYGQCSYLRDYVKVTKKK
ncbi:hypothetical protein [Chitinophaga eiseniae]|uniref:Tetratricopeptide repeat-containing protein n=1 Tax=Chitinophaga eiseniae TaxID=634771 RepID=A0A847SPJ3_9BACT|nr:hypothetical protein [Chitinophaga eiseniae]NLR81843.1 hypothetical protein [Chitinophaga eiseniae]